MTDNGEIIKRVGTTFDRQLAVFILSSNDPFPVDFDWAWQVLGYTRKNNAKRQLSKFREGVEFRSDVSKSSQGGRSSEIIKLSAECFRHLAMLAQTEQGWIVRNYFMECEKIAKSRLFPKSEIESLSSAIPFIDSELKAVNEQKEKIFAEIDLLQTQAQNLQERYRGVQVRYSELWIKKHQDIINEYPRHKAIVDQSKLPNDDDIPSINFASWDLNEK